MKVCLGNMDMSELYCLLSHSSQLLIVFGQTLSFNSSSKLFGSLSETIIVLCCTFLGVYYVEENEEVTVYGVIRLELNNLINGIGFSFYCVSYLK